MTTRYNPLLQLNATCKYFGPTDLFDDLVLEPTAACRSLLRRYKLLFRSSAGKWQIYYESTVSSIPPAIPEPSIPISVQEKFSFILKVRRRDFWYYANAVDWSAGTVYLLKNTLGGSADEDLLDGPLSGPIQLFPPIFSYTVELVDTPGLLQVRDVAGAIVYQDIVRSRTSSEPINKMVEIPVDLTGRPEGTYNIVCVNQAGTEIHTIYCTSDYSPAALAVLELDYTWTGTNPSYSISIDSLSTDWIYDVHINHLANMIHASDMVIRQVVAPPTVTVDQVAGSIPPAGDFVQFKSTTPIPFRKNFLQLELYDSGSGKVLIGNLPVPSPQTLQLNGSTPVSTMIVNL